MTHCRERRYQPQMQAFHAERRRRSHLRCDLPAEALFDAAADPRFVARFSV